MSKDKNIKKEIEEAIKQLWEVGNLEWKLKGNQKIVKEAFKNATGKTHTVLCSRRFGKTYVLCCWAMEVCLQIPNAVVKYACPEKAQAEEIVNDIIPNFILNDCPDYLKPKWMEQKKAYHFPNGSKIQIAGTNKDKGNKLRGGRANLCIVDEAQDHNYLSYVINSVLAPTTDTTGGHVVLAGTPNPLVPNHDFHIDYIKPLEDEGKLIKFTVYDSPKYEEEGELFIKELEDRYRHRGGLKAPAFKCEYLCEISIDQDSMVIPEFTPEKQQEIVKENDRPAHYDIYTSADPGFKDLTGILFSYYDFEKASIIIEDEHVINGPELTTERLAEDVRKKELLNFKDPVSNLPLTPFMRIMDNNNPILINDLFRLHNIMFTATAKDNKEAQINQVRLMVNQGRILINPKCKNLIYQLKNAKWAKNRKEFERIKDSPSGELKGGHADLVDALIYLVRNVIQGKNPYPDGYGLPSENTHHFPTGSKPDSRSMTDMIFGKKRKK